MQIRIKLLLLFIGLMSGFQVFSQTEQKREISTRQQQHIEAYRYLYGINTSVNYKKAKNIYESLAVQYDTEALNKLGTMYKNGLGVKQNNDSALYFFRESAAYGNSKGLYNLGLMYKNGDGVEQDFNAAFKLFKQAMENGNKSAYYSVGYFYYKGLGVEQDYEKANQHFKTGADKGEPSCMFFYGYAHLRGYGTVQDTVVGKEWIKKSAKKGYGKGIDFIKKHKNVKSYMHAKTKDLGADLDAQKPKKLAKANRFKKDKLGNHDVGGLWEGKLISYDWSGEKLEKERKLELTLTMYNNTMRGFWIQDDSIKVRIEGHKTDSNWVFVNSKYTKKQRYRWVLEKGSFELIQENGKEYLKGTVVRSSVTKKEPERPLYIVLEKSSSNKSRSAKAVDNTPDLENIAAALAVSPNPFSQQLNIKLRLSAPQYGRFLIVDASGVVVYQTVKKAYERGVTEEQLQLGLTKGVYTLQFFAKEFRLSTLIIKE